MASPSAHASTAARTRARRAAADPLALDAQLCFALYSASLAMTKRYRPLLDAIGLTYPQYLVMLALWEGDGLTVSALGERLRLDSGTLTPLLKRLEALGLLQRQRAADDERRVCLTLTAAGRQLRRRALPIPPQLAEVLGCSAPERAALTAALRSLRDTLAPDAGTPRSPDAA
jgi:DNA-binding MarR family transcriptional regulator